MGKRSPAKKNEADSPENKKIPDKIETSNDVETPDDGEVAAAVSRSPADPMRFPIVGIGASAGGLEALQEFFSHTPPDTGMGFVVITHQHPGHISLLPALLSKCTQMPVVEAHDEQIVEPNRVYINPSGGFFTIAGGMLRHQDGSMSNTSHLPIDQFLRSLAVDQREHAICVILSGTGTDGTLGMRAIKAEAGMAMVQEPPSAKYAGMPASAASTGLVDYVLPPQAMAEQLIAYSKGPYLNPRMSEAEKISFPHESLQKILVILRTRTGHDFRSYKMTTIRRRIERRMNVHQIKDPQEYIIYLQENPHEIDLLFGELLISVTGFFRDPQAFEVLCEKVVPELLKSRPSEHKIRVWIPGCASGEEAYSIAILLHECMEKLKVRFETQIFGTDLDAHAIEAARAGIYSGNIATDVSKERLERYFTREDNIYKIRKDIREMLVFASQNVIKDPPFTKLDLIVCRNVLIYLDAELQRRLLPIFHYALRPGGILFLGPSESIGGFGEIFQTIDGKWKIYQRRETLLPMHPIMDLQLESIPPRPADSPSREIAAAKQTHTIENVERLLLARYAPTSVIVDERGSIVYIHGRTGAFLEPTEGQPRNNILEMARPGLSRPLAAAIRQAAVGKQDSVHDNIRVKSNGGFTQLKLTVSRIEDPESIRGLLLVTLQPSSPAPPQKKTAKQAKREESRAGRVEELVLELQFVKESLQRTIEELETSNEELKSTNEELQSTNEELQSTNEELETSKEEMQSLNEELSTVNAELQAKVDELSRASDDMQNLLNNTQVPTIFLDGQLNVKLYTEQIKDLFNLIPTDIGRSLSHITSKLEYSRLIDDCRDVLRTLVRKEVEVHDGDGEWHSMRIMPYRTADNVIEGVVVTFVNISEMKEAEEEANVVCNCFSDIVQTAHKPMVMLDSNFRAVAANRAFCEAAGREFAQVSGMPLFDIPYGRTNLRELKGILDEVAKSGKPSVGVEVARDSSETGGEKLSVIARRLKLGPDQRKMIILCFADRAREP